MRAEYPTPFTADTFGRLLRRYRLAAGLTQEELAERSGLSVRGISDLERGRKRTPRHETLRLLADALALTPHKRALLEKVAHPLTSASQLLSEPATNASVVQLVADQASTAPHNLPVGLTPLIGRERETLALATMLRRRDVRLLSLIGPGGVGKTRLAYQGADDVLADFEDGVFAIPMADVHEPLRLPGIISEALGMPSTPGKPPAEQLATYLAGKQLLLLLDNFEHLLDATPQISALLAACPHLKTLVTSREPLRLEGEFAMPVAPLAEDAARELFLQRAMAANPSLDVAAIDPKIVDAICRRVDRLPLAIELAAPWTKVLSLPELLDRLSHPLSLLTGGRRDAPERQRTLRETIAWSEHLLAPEEQRLFRHLAIFSGGATLSAIETICDKQSQSGLTPEATLVSLARLVEQNLLVAEKPVTGAGEGSEPEARFRVLETIHSYAQELLSDDDEQHALHLLHAEYYAQVALELGRLRPGQAGQDGRDRRLMQELPNIHAALAWAYKEREAGIGMRLATPLGRFWYSHSAFDEGGKWLRRFLALDAEAGQRAVEPHVRVMALYSLILLTLDQHDYEQAEALANEGLALAREHGDGVGIGNMLTELGHVAEAHGDLDAAFALFEAGLASFRESGHDGATGRTLSSLGNAARARGDYALARRYLEQSLAWARARDFSWAVASGLVSLGHLACEQDEPDRALACYREGLTYYQTMPNPVSVAWLLEGAVVALVALKRPGDGQVAARFCGAIAGLRRLASVVPGMEWPAFERAREAAGTALGETAFAEAYHGGMALSPEQSIAEGLANL